MIQSFLDTFDLDLGPVGNTQARTGYGFTSKLLIGVNYRTDDSPEGNVQCSFGFCNGVTTARNVAWSMSETVGTTSSGGSLSTTRFLGNFTISGGSAPVDGEWEISAIGADGVTVRVIEEHDSPSQTLAAKILALGGSGIQGVEFGALTVPSAPGTTAASGHSFAPDAVLFLSNSGAFAGVAIGAACKRGAVTSATSGSHFDDAQVSQTNTKSYSRSGECISLPTAGADGIAQRGQLTAWSSDGFTVTWLDDPASAGQTVYYAAIKMAPGFGVQILTGTTITGTGAVNLTTTGGFLPAAGFMVSHCKAESAADTEDADGGLSIGLFSGTTQGAISWYADDDGSPTTVTNANSATSAYVNCTDAAVEGQAAITGLSGNTIACNQSDGDPSVAFVWALAFGSIPRAGGSPIFF
jgi:hypothetical protein